MFLVTNVSTWQYKENNQRIAVCKSTYKMKAPTLHWEPALNFSSNISSVKKLGKFFMLENQVYLPENLNISELTCVATYTSESGSVQHKSTLITGEQWAHCTWKWTENWFHKWVISEFCFGCFFIYRCFYVLRGWFLWIRFF